MVSTVIAITMCHVMHRDLFHYYSDAVLLVCDRFTLIAHPKLCYNTLMNSKKPRKFPNVETNVLLLHREIINFFF